MATLSFRNINKIYPNKVQAVFDFNLEVADKEFIVFVGPSGCGKSTTLRMVAGLEEISSGELYIDGVLINNVAPKDRNIAMVFQSYALYPHMTVYENMAFALKLRKVPRPVYLENHDIDPILEENKQIRAEIKKINKKFKKKQNSDELLPPRAELYKKLYANLDKIASMQKPLIGRDEYNISQLTKELAKLASDSIHVEKVEAETKAELEALNERLAQEQPAFDAMNKDADVKAYEAAEKSLNKVIDAIKDDERFLRDCAAAKIQKADQTKKVQERLEFLKNNDVEICKVRHLTKEEIDIEINKAAESIDLIRYLFRKPAALSGGQRQRVALGRAIVRKPKVFLMDEPLSNLDAKLRVQTRSEITKIHERVGATTIYVTHDQTEAMTMANRIVIMKDGYIQQIGTPDEVYNDPANRFVGGFIGSPAMNFLSGVYTKGKFTIGEGDNATVIKLTKQYDDLLKEREGEKLILGARPESIYLEGDKNNEAQSAPLKLDCDFAELLGNELVLYTYINGTKTILKTSAKEKVKTHDPISICFDMNKLYFFEDGDNGARIK